MGGLCAGVLAIPSSGAPPGTGSLDASGPLECCPLTEAFGPRGTEAPSLFQPFEIRPRVTMIGSQGAGKCMRVGKMYKRILTAVLACLVGLIGAAGTANAGSFSNGPVTVTWRDDALVHPGDDWRACTNVAFSVTKSQPSLLTVVAFNDADKLASIPDSDVSKKTQTTTHAGFEGDEGVHFSQFCNTNRTGYPVNLSNLIMSITYINLNDRASGWITAETPFSLRPASEFATAAPAPTPAPEAKPKKRGVKCERIYPYKIKTFKKRYECPKGWVQL